MEKAKNCRPGLTVILPSGPRPAPVLKLVKTSSAQSKPSVDERLDLDWSILMARAQDGDQAAYRRLLELITPYLRSVAARRHSNQSDIEDAVQDILLAIHTVRASYDPVRPFGPWLLAIANRRLIDRLRMQGRRRRQETELTDEHENIQAISAGDTAIMSHELGRAIDMLPPNERQAMRLTKIQGLSLDQASATSGMSIVSLKVATHRAIKRLRQILTSRDGS